MRRRGLFKMRFISNRKGTAEVIGAILFVIILMFLFANVYLWHDAAVKDANAMNIKQMNAGMTLSYENQELDVTAASSDVYLYRVWLVHGDDHYYAELDAAHVTAGVPYTIELDDDLEFTNDIGGSLLGGSVGAGDRLAVINTLGIKAELVVP